MGALMEFAPQMDHVQVAAEICWGCKGSTADLTLRHLGGEFGRGGRLFGSRRDTRLDCERVLAWLAGAGRHKKLQCCTFPRTWLRPRLLGMC